MAAQNIISPAKAFFKGLSLGKKITFAVLIGGTFAGMMMLILWSGRPDFQPMYTNLAPEDAGAVIEQLKAEKIPYKVTGGNSIMVPKDRVFETTMMLASQGLPRGGGVGFEIFDNTKLGMTEFEQNVSYQRALQGELARTISRFEEVKSCRVHIVMATRSLFVSQEKPASASVILELVPGRHLDKKQIQGILHLISTSVPGLAPDRVTMVDNGGNLLTAAADGNEGESRGATHFEMQHHVERNLEMRVQSMLEEALGTGKSIVRVSCELNFDQQEMTEEKYDPDKVVRSEQISDTMASGEGGGAAGVPGVMSNMTDRGRGSAQGGDRNQQTRREQTSNYEISKITRHVVNPVGSIRRISVAVMVDGSYKPKKAAGAPTEGEGQAAPEEPVEMEYVPRSDAELETLSKIVKGAVNFNAERGDQVEVVNLQFVATAQSETPAAAALTGWRATVKEYMPYTKYLFIGLAVLMAYLFILRPVIKWLTYTPVIDGQLLKQLPMTVGEIEKGYDGKGALPIDDRLHQAVADNKDRTIQLIRQWIGEK